MAAISARLVLILTIVTIVTWIGYETYSTLTRATRQAVVKQELLRNLDKAENDEVLDNLGGRLSY